MTTLQTLIILTIPGCLSDFQDHSINPTEQPYYSLSGVVIEGEDDSPVPFAMVTLSMTYAYTGAWHEDLWVLPDTVYSDSLGRYTMDSLYLGSYHLMVYDQQELRYSNTIDFLQYSDREFDIVIPFPWIDLYGTIEDCDSLFGVSDMRVFLTPIELFDGAVMDPRETTTATSGQFIIRDIFPGNYSLQAHRWDYYPLNKNVRIYRTVEDKSIMEFCVGKIDFSSAQ